MSDPSLPGPKNGILTKGFNYPFKHIVYTGYIFLFGLKYREKQCIPSHDALKDMVRLNITPALVEAIILDGIDHRNGMMGKNEIGRSIRKGRFEISVNGG